MSDESRLNAQVSLGQAVEDFRASAVGQFLIARAGEYALDAIDELKNVEPFEEGALQKIAAAQLKMRTGEHIIAWLEETVTAAQNAEEQLRQAHDDRGPDSIG